MPHKYHRLLSYALSCSLQPRKKRKERPSNHFRQIKKGAYSPNLSLRAYDDLAPSAKVGYIGGGHHEFEDCDRGADISGTRDAETIWYEVVFLFLLSCYYPVDRWNQ